jgi:hypothetical protein
LLSPYKLTMSDATRAQFQLAHETVHLLDPVVAGTANVLEEGLATYYQLEYIRRMDSNYSTGDEKYDAASSLVSSLMTEYPDAIKTLRGQGRTISTLTAHQLQSVYLNLSDEAATILAHPFRDWDGTISCT